MLRSASSEDVPVIYKLICALATYEKLGHEVVATEGQLRATLFGEHPSAEVLLAEKNKEIIGFALFFYNYSTFLGKKGLYLEDLFVLPSYRGQGVGKALLQRLAQVAVKQDCGRMEWSVLNWNKPSIAFYESLGAQPQSRWTVYRLTENALSTLAEKTRVQAAKPTAHE
ncbi:MAG: GNAT family N-acetyltransferase [Myxococcales bacterium]|nr:GNAT family N-acetyltransferase [Myxococcales bacterium]